MQTIDETEQQILEILDQRVASINHPWLNLDELRLQTLHRAACNVKERMRVGKVGYIGMYADGAFDAFDYIASLADARCCQVAAFERISTNKPLMVYITPGLRSYLLPMLKELGLEAGERE